MNEISLSDSRLIALTCNSIINSIHLFSKMLFLNEFVKFIEEINCQLIDSDKTTALSLFGRSSLSKNIPKTSFFCS